MEEYVLLQKDNMGAYAHMIPAWLFMKPGEEKEVQFWGMSDFKTPCGVAVLSRSDYATVFICGDSTPGTRERTKISCRTFVPCPPSFSPDFSNRIYSRRIS